MASREGGAGWRIGGRIGELRNIGDPRDTRRGLGAVPKGPAAPGMPGFGENAAARVLFEPVRHAPAYYDPQPSSIDSGKPPKPAPWATWKESPGPGRSKRADERSGYSSQGLLFDPAKYAAQAGNSAARVIQAAIEGAPQGSVYTALPDEDRAVRLPKFAAFSRESGAQPQSLTEAIRKGALDGTLALRGRDPGGSQLLIPLGRRVTRADVDAAVESGYRVTARPSDAAVAAEIGKEGSGVFTQPGYRPDVWEYASQNKEPGALGEPGVLIQLNPDGSDFLAVTNNEVLEYVKQREADLVDRLPKDARRYAPMRDPVVSLGGEDVATPKDLRRYDPGESRQWRAMRAVERKRKGRDGRKVNPPKPPGPRSDGYLDGELGAGRVGAKEAKGDRLYKEYGGALNLASRTLNQNPTRAFRIQQGERSGQWQPGGTWVDPAMVVLTRDMDPDSTAAWDRQKEVRLPEFTQFLLDKYKTPLLRNPEEVLASDRFIPEKTQGAVKGNTRVGQILVTERPNHPMFQGLDLPEVAEAINQRKPLVTAAVPLYRAEGESGGPLYRIGHPMNRNYDALLKEFNQATGLARDVDVDPVGQVQVSQDHYKAKRYVSAPELEAVRRAGYSIIPTDNPFLSRYEAAPGGALDVWGDSGYLVKPTIVAAGGINTGTPEPSTRMIRVGNDEWNSGRFSKAHTGVDLLSLQPGVRKAIEERRDINPEGWTTISLLNALAEQAGAEPGFAGPVAGVESFMDPVNPGAFSIALGQAVPRGADGRQSETRLEQLRQVTQTLANNARFVQDPIPGLLSGVDPRAGLERLPARRPGQAGPRTLKELWLRTSRQERPDLLPDERIRDVRARMDQQRAAVLAEAAAAPRSELAGTPLLDILAASGGESALAASPSLAELYPGSGVARYLGEDGYEPSPRDMAVADALARIKANEREPGRGSGLVVVRPGEDGAISLIGQSASVAPVPQRVLAPDAPGDAGLAQSSDFDEEALLEELGLVQRQPGWSDLVDTGNDEGMGNLGYRVLERPGDADGPITGRQAALEPFARLARRLGNLSPEHAALVAESAFAQAGAPSGLPSATGGASSGPRRAVPTDPAYAASLFEPGRSPWVSPLGYAAGSPIDDMAIARRVAEIVRPDLATTREEVHGLGNSPAPWLAPKEGTWMGQRGDRYRSPREPNYPRRGPKIASVSPQGELQARQDFRNLLQADAEAERAAYLRKLWGGAG